MDEEGEDALTVEALPAYLKIPESKRCNPLRNGHIPGQKLGRHLRLHRKVVDLWPGVRGQNEK